MADNKKYYYLKLKDNFFDSDEMIVLESMPDGYKYSNILLKLYLRSLKDEGKLMFNDRIPYNSTILAKVTRHSVGDVEKAIQVLRDLDIIEVLDNGAIYMNDIQNFIGKSSTEADRKRQYRQKIETEKLLLSGQMSDECPDKSPPEIEIEIEIEKEIEIEIEQEEKSPPPPPIDYERIQKLFNEKCISLPPIAKITDKRKQSILARVREYGIESIDTVIDNASKSKFMAGDNQRNWVATFDWIIKPSNYIKVMEGNYLDKGGNKNGEDTKDDQYDLEKHGIGFSM